ncbi:GNAT family N-acetyltransferase [Citricoccus sp. GCM10030269]|uniref:GNAT family N-acetyltransferase n=1 Tax=Citricoccus sp. GCM10030269 TaxID=3273388 RepID=UPI00360B2C7B
MNNDLTSVDWLELPHALDQTRLPMPPSTADFLQVAQLANLVSSLFWGNNDFYASAESQLAAATAREHVRTSYAVAREPDRPERIIGYAALSVQNGQSAEIHVDVHPDFRRRGVGSAVLREAEAEAARRGCTVLQSWTDNALVDPDAVDSGPVFVAGTSLQTGLTPVVRQAEDRSDQQTPDDGRAGVRWQAPDAAFAAAHGYALAQLEWTSVLKVREAAGAALLAESGSSTAEDHGYELVGWEGPCPEEFAASMAELSGLSDLSGGVSVAALRSEDRAREQRGQTVVTTAARDRSTGRLVGYSDIETFDDLPQAVYQGATVIHPEHSGRQLSLLLQAVNISRLLRYQPETERLYAWGAVEEELGFVPVATHPAWQKAL